MFAKTALKIRIRLQSALALFAVLATSCDPVVVPSAASNTHLVWAEEFDGASVDLTRWTFENGNGGWGNSELEYYQSQNSSILAIPSETSKALVITAKSESVGGSAYTSSRLKTQGKASWTYGKIEARMKLPQGQGIWPAFWMLGESISSVGWPACGEIDIMEMIGGAGTRDQTEYGTLHWSDAGGGHASQGKSVVLASKLSNDFHIYTMEWSASKMIWSVDGVVFQVQDITNAAQTEFHQPQFIVLNLAVGGNWPGSPDGTTVLPQQLWVDWIRVYQN